MGGRVYAFAGGKGGVGKTTVTANVAIALQELDCEVAAVDADLGMTNLGAVLDIEPDVGIHHVLGGSASVEDVLVEGPRGIGVVPGEAGIQATGDADPSRLNAVLDPLREQYDVVLLDTGAGISHQNVMAFGLADAVALVATPSALAANDVAKTADLVERADGTVAGLVVTHVATHDEWTQAGELAAELDTDLLGAIPTYEHEDVQEPRVIEAPAAPATSEYERLAVALSVYQQTGDIEEVYPASDVPAVFEPAADEDDSEPTESGGLVDRFRSALK